MATSSSTSLQSSHVSTYPGAQDYFENTIHASCNNCHHFHIGKLVKLPLNLDAYVRVPCENCRKPLFSIGRASTKSSLASEFTSTSFDVYRSRYQSRDNLSISGLGRHTHILSEPVQYTSPVPISGRTTPQPVSIQAEETASERTQNQGLEGNKENVSFKTHHAFIRLRRAFHKLRLHGPFKPSSGPLSTPTNKHQPKPPTANVATMTDKPALLESTIIRALPVPRINTQHAIQQTIQEAEEEESPLAGISTDIFADQITSETDQRSKRLHAIRSEKTVKKRTQHRLKYQNHCSTCRCRGHPPNLDPTLDGNDSVATNRPATQQSTLSTSSPTTQVFVDLTNPPLFAGSHLLRSASPSAMSERSFASAATLYERRGSQASHRTNSLPTGAREFVAFAQQMRPGVLAALRLYDESQGARNNEESIVGTRLSAPFSDQSSLRDGTRGRSPLRNSLRAYEEEDSTGPSTVD
jgi:hypothetical protein